MYRYEDTLQGVGGLPLYYQVWMPDEDTTRILIVVHGIGEHSGRYTELIEHLVSAGNIVYTYDQRGHGRSPGRRGHIDSWEDFRGDLRTFVERIEMASSGDSIFLMGHSMGALIVADYITEYPEGIKGVIVSGIPLVPGNVATRFQISVARFLSKVWPTFPMKPNLKPEDLSRDPEVVRAYREDPKVHGILTARAAVEVLETIRRVTERAPQIRVPLLILHGEKDRISLLEGGNWLYDNVESKSRALLIYPESYHEPHNDLDRGKVYQDIQDWIEYSVQEE